MYLCPIWVTNVFAVVFKIGGISSNIASTSHLSPMRIWLPDQCGKPNNNKGFHINVVNTKRKQTNRLRRSLGVSFHYLVHSMQSFPSSISRGLFPSIQTMPQMQSQLRERKKRKQYWRNNHRVSDLENFRVAPRASDLAPCRIMQ